MEKETRTIQFEIRKSTDADKPRRIEGYAALFDTRTDLVWFDETIAPGAFDEADMSDVVALFNHDPNLPLARTSSGTLDLKIDERGLFYSFEVPDTSTGRDLLTLIERGDISQSSFAFTINKESWTDEQGEKTLRTIEKIEKLYDVSPVTYPAYSETTALARKREERMKKDNAAQLSGADKDYPALQAAIFSLSKKISTMKRSIELRQLRGEKITALKAITEAAAGAVLTDEQRASAQTLQAEITRIDDDIALAEMLEAEEVAAAKRAKPAQKAPEQKAAERFSLLRAIKYAAEGKPLDGIEAEMQQEAISEFRASGITPSGNLQIPRMIASPERRDMTAGTTTAGGFTIPTELGELIPFLDPRLAVIDAGATMLTGLMGNIDLPRNDAAATATWEGENDANAETSPTFDRIQLSPNRLGAFTDISKQLLVQSSIDVERFIRERLNFAISRALDYALINGDGSTIPITGILNTAGIGSVAIGTNGGVPTWAHIVNLETEVAVDNADFGSLAYLTTPGIRGKLKQTEKASSTGMFVWQDNPAPASGPRIDSLNGYRALVSTQVPSDLTKGSGTALHAILFGNFRELIVGQWAGIDVVVDPYSGAKNALVTLVVNSWWDAALRHAQSFSAVKDASLS